MGGPRTFDDFDEASKKLFSTLVDEHNMDVSLVVPIISEDFGPGLSVRFVDKASVKQMEVVRDIIEDMGVRYVRIDQYAGKPQVLDNK